MIVTHDSREAREWAERVRAAGLSVGLVPTMGALHAGHHALIERARAECDRVAVTVYVNPTQFSSTEDLETYPRTTAEDEAACRERGVDLVLLGESTGDAGIYADGFQTWIKVEELSRPCCGRFRPGHFRGVATVVAILFGIFRPHRAYFGEKDYQQARVIDRLARDLRTGVEVRTVPSVRDADGLALSSRNVRLDADARRVALAIPRALQSAVRAVESGEDRAARIQALVTEELEAAEGLDVQYVEALDAETLREPGDVLLADLPGGLLVAVAAIAGGVRLIDNVVLFAPGRERESSAPTTGES